MSGWVKRQAAAKWKVKWILFNILSKLPYDFLPSFYQDALRYDFSSHWVNACALLGQLVRGALDSFCAGLPTGELSGSGAFCVLCPVATSVWPWPFLIVCCRLPRTCEWACIQAGIWHCGHSEFLKLSESKWSIFWYWWEELAWSCYILKHHSPSENSATQKTLLTGLWILTPWTSWNFSGRTALVAALQRKHPSTWLYS